jgi:hypothetical protein
MEMKIYIIRMQSMSQLNGDYNLLVMVHEVVMAILAKLRMALIGGMYGEHTITLTF